MGKYDTNKEWSRNELLQFIANELAELNKLKRIDLQSRPYNHESYKELIEDLVDTT